MDRPDPRRIDDPPVEPEAEPPVATPETDNDWVNELIAMTRPGIEINFPVRGLRDRVVPFEFDDFD